MKTITAHCIVKNEENFIQYAVKSVIDFVDRVIIFDTGSRDATISIIERLRQEYPTKIIFEQKGECDKKRHTELRQEMIEKTTTDWFMILDGDEVWTQTGIKEVLDYINKDSNIEIECLIAPFHLCVGDIEHEYKKEGTFNILGKAGHFSLRVIKKTKNVHWQGDYNDDTLVFEDKGSVFREENTIFLKNKYWHLTHLRRSSRDDAEYSSYGSRKEKRRETYFFIGKKIKNPPPEVFDELFIKKNKVTKTRSFLNFVKMFPSLFAHTIIAEFKK